MLEVDGVVAGYGQLDVLHGVGLRVPAGRVVGLLGANGAGKTTLMKAIMGFIPTKSGRIAFDGEPMVRLAPHAIVHRGLTLVPQGREIFGAMTVHENLDVAGLGASSTKARAALIEQQLEIFPRLRERLDQRAQTLSGGEQQMLAIARALMVEPKMLLLDEPTMGLAPRVVADLARVIRTLNGLGHTILLVEQNLGLVLATTEQVYVIGNGRNVFDGQTSALKDDRSVLRMYLE